MWLYFLINLISQRLFSLRVPAGLINKKTVAEQRARDVAGPGALHQRDWTNCVVCVCTVGVFSCHCGHTPLKQTHLILLVPVSVNSGGGLNAAAAALEEVWFCKSDVDVLITSLPCARRFRPPRYYHAALRQPLSPQRRNEKCRAAREERKDCIPHQHHAAAL